MLPKWGIVLFSFVAVVYLIVWTISVSLFFRRRHNYPINSRRLDVLAATAFGLLTFFEANAFIAIYRDETPCIVVLFMFHLVVFAIFNMYFVRLWIMWFNYKCTQEKLILSSRQEFWYLERTWMIKPAFYWKVFLMGLLIEFLVPVSLHAAGMFDCLDPQSFFLSWAGPFFLVSCGMLFTGIKFREVQDAFFIKRELRNILFYAIPSGIVQLIELVFVSTKYPLLYEVTNTLNVIGGAATVLISSFTFLVQKTYAGYDEPSKELEFILQTKTGRKAFTKHLTKEFSIENLLFFDEVNNFFKMTDGKLLERNTEIAQVNWEALRLYRKFIQMNGHLQVNISYKTFGSIYEELKQIFEGVIDIHREKEFFEQSENFELQEGVTFERAIDSVVFHKAKNEIRQLLRTCLTRFKMTQSCFDYEIDLVEV